MKRISTALIIVLSLCVSSLVGQDLPKDGAILVLNQRSFDLKQGIDLIASVEIVKSKRYQKAKFDGLSARTPEGINVTFKKDPSRSNFYQMTLSADESATKESYTIIIKGGRYKLS